MGKSYDEITPELAEWIGQQRLFFVATAPLSRAGLVNCSPKGMDTFRIIGQTTVGYLDLTGSGIETAAHLSENGRTVFVFCAFTGSPRIIRLHGIGTYHRIGSSGFKQVHGLFPSLPGTRGVVLADIRRVSESCGFAVPRYEFLEERDTLVRWAESKGPDELELYRKQKNTKSLDGLPVTHETF